MQINSSLLGHADKKEPLLNRELSKKQLPIFAN